MEPFDIAIEVERFMSAEGLTASDSIETLLERMYEYLEEELK